MSVDIEVVDRAQLPGPGPDAMRGFTIVIPIPTTAADLTLLNRDCVLCGWSLREATGLGGAVVEWFDGPAASGVLAGAADLTQGFDPAASQTPTDNTATGAAAAIAATLTAAAGQLIFLTSLRIEGLGATAATEVQATLVGVQGGTITYPVNVPAGVAVPIAPVTDQFGGRGLPASSAGTNIVLNVPSFGAGNTFAEAELQGYIQSAAGVSDSEWFGPDGPLIRVGLVLHPVSGSVRGAAYVRI